MTNLEAFGGRRNLAVAAPQGDTTHRTPPHNIEAEQALLGAILVNNDAFDSVSGFLQPEHFSEALHQRIFEIASQLIRAGKVATPVTLKTFLTEQDVGHGVTVSQYLARLAAEATPIILAEDYGRTVLDLSVRRDLAIIGEDIVNSAHDAPVDSSPWMQIAEASAKLSEISLADTPAAQLAFKASSLAADPAPPREWLVKGMFPMGQVTILNGDGGIGKSLLAKQLAVSTALGVSWLGHEVRQGPAIFFTAEDDRDEIHRRLENITRETGETMESLSDLHIMSLAGMDAVLAAVELNKLMRPTPLFRRLEAAIGRIRPALVVIDTLADVFGGNEIERAQVRQFIGLLRGLAIKYACAVLLLAHPSVAGMANGSGSSGSTAWNNSVRSRLYMTRPKAKSEDDESDPHLRELTVMKANHGPTGGKISLRYQSGIFVNETQPQRSLPKYVSEFQDRHGKWRLRFRRKGRAHYFECTIAWSAEFMQEYAGFLKERGTPPEAGASRTKVGTFDSLIAGYYREPMYTGKRESTRKAYRGIIERFRAEHGQKSVANIQRKHIAAIVGGMSATPGAANHLLDRLRVLMKLAIREGHRRDNPALDVEGFEEGKGFHSWTEEEIERFELRHPPRSKAHLALIIVLCTGQRRSDAVTMGWHKVTADGRLRVRQIKTDEELAIPVLPALREAIADLPRDAPAFPHDRERQAIHGRWIRKLVP
jgi:KaiC/GvpD/RAD55 family RecA-like ATPase